MDYDQVINFIRTHPDCTSAELAEQFQVKPAKAFTFMNDLIRHGIVFKTDVRSPTNNKWIYGYRVNPNHDLVNEDEIIMPAAVIIRNLRNAYVSGTKEDTLRKIIQTHNHWREEREVDLLHEYETMFAATDGWRALHEYANRPHPRSRHGK